MACLAGDLVHVSRGPNFPRDGTDNGDHGPHNPYAGLILTATPRWVRGVAWSILGGSGPLDSGSNPDGPIHQRSGPSANPCTVSNAPECSQRTRFPTQRSPGRRSTNPTTTTLGGVDGDVADHAPTSIRDGPERHRPRGEEEYEESRRAAAGEVVAVRRPVVDVRECVRRVILIEQRNSCGGEGRDIERARREPGILRQDGDVRRGRDVVKRPGHRNGRQQVLIGKGSRRHGPDAHRHESDGRKAVEAVNPLGQIPLPQYFPSTKVTDNSCGQGQKD